MIDVDQVTMRFPKPRRYVDVLVRPFQPPRYTSVFEGIDLLIAPHDHVAVLGANGAGKTTLLKLMGGILYPTHGRVRINGRETTNQNLEARRNVAFVTNEDRSFYWRLSGYENLRFFGNLDNLFGRDLERRIGEVMALVGIDRVNDTPISDYSTGMRQRLAIARALLGDPDILLLDEPTRSLDMAGATAIRELLHANVGTASRRTLVVMTNNAEDVIALCQRVYVLHGGSIVAGADVARLDQAQVEALFNKVTGRAEATG
jgi:ABC-2 type transport system ATP-binding protein